VDTPSIGILMLDTHFPRFTGDVGNPKTWPFDVIFKRVQGASARAVISSSETADIQPFVSAAKELEDKGVAGITTSCGFLILAQQRIAQNLKVPFASSSLLQIPWVNAILPHNKRAGILTIERDSISQQHLHCAGAPLDTPIMGTETGQEFTRSILEDHTSMDRQLCEAENIDAAKQLVQQYPQVGAIVLECTNMAPYAHAISVATQRPVYSIVTLVSWLQSGLRVHSFSH